MPQSTDKSKLRPRGQRRTYVTVPMTMDEADVIELAAARKGTKLATFLRESAISRARSVLRRLDSDPLSPAA